MTYSQYYMVDTVSGPSATVAHDEPLRVETRLHTIVFETPSYEQVAVFDRNDVKAVRSVTKEIAHAEIAHRQRMEMRASEPASPLRSSLIDQMFGDL